MACKVGLNRQEQLLNAKWIKEGVSPEDLAKKFHTSVEVVLRFTQEKLDAAANKAKERTVKSAKAAKAQSKKAAILSEVLKTPDEDGDDNFS